jgi:hypothetical protein
MHVSTSEQGCSRNDACGSAVRSPRFLIPFPPGLLAQAMSHPGGWVYANDPEYAADGANGAVPPEGIIGAWKVADDGTSTGEHQANPQYGSRSRRDEVS